jgi:hypothetical protein
MVDIIRDLLRVPEYNECINVYPDETIQQVCDKYVKENEDQYKDILIISPRVSIDNTTMTDDKGVVHKVTTYQPEISRGLCCDCMIVDMECVTRDQWYCTVCPLLQINTMKAVFLVSASTMIDLV